MSLRLSLLACTASLLCTADDPLRDLVDRVRDIESVVALIERESALPADRAALWSGAVRGMVEAADPHGRYLAPDEVAIYGLDQEPLRHGLGLSWRHDRRLLVTRVVRGGPAERAGLRAGSELTMINGAAVAGLGRRAVAEALARSGDTVALAWRSGDGEASATLTRATVRDDGLDAIEDLGDGILRLAIGRFVGAGAEGGGSTLEALQTALAAAPGTRGLVLDLRGCAGGNLQAAVDVAGAWLPAGLPVVEQIGRDPARSRMWSAGGEARLPRLPLAVLIDGGTASAAEVLAAALRRGLRAPLVGDRTQGKWTVQQLLLLPRGDAVVLTVARLRQPGADQGAPLVPDLNAPAETSIDLAVAALRTLLTAGP
jgi:carboxyl-terminal processing protease